MSEDPARHRKTAIIYSGAAALGLALMAFPSFSAPLSLPEPFVERGVIRADDMNERFEELYTALNQQRRSNGLFCGRTAIASNAAIGGYETASTSCASAPGCAAETAHMCTTVEAVASVSQGLELPVAGGWVASGYSDYDGGATGTNDCEGFTSDTELENGVVWSGDRAGSSNCSNDNRIMCCD